MRGGIKHHTQCVKEGEFNRIPVEYNMMDTDEYKYVVTKNKMRDVRYAINCLRYDNVILRITYIPKTQYCVPDYYTS